MNRRLLAGIHIGRPNCSRYGAGEAALHCAGATLC